MSFYNGCFYFQARQYTNDKKEFEKSAREHTLLHACQTKQNSAHTLKNENAQVCLWSFPVFQKATQWMVFARMFQH